MKKVTCVLAILAAASTAALAKDLKQNKQAPTVSATQMTDSEMDRVTGGQFFVNGNGTTVDNPGRGHGFGIGRGNGAFRPCC